MKDPNILESIQIAETFCRTNKGNVYDLVKVLKEMGHSKADLLVIISDILAHKCFLKKHNPDITRYDYYIYNIAKYIMQEFRTKTPYRRFKRKDGYTVGKNEKRSYRGI